MHLGRELLSVYVMKIAHISYDIYWHALHCRQVTPRRYYW